jgi:cytochrome c-type biogenesis protein CcmE
MNAKVVVGVLVILVGIILGTINFLNTNVEYGSFAMARKTHKKIQVKGEWLRDREATFDAEKILFTFYMKDDSGEVMKIVLNSPKPNNFEIANSIVAKGKYIDSSFHATEILTKCPSKYEGKLKVKG